MKIVEDDRPVCTKEKPLREMGLGAKHPRAKYLHTVNEDHGDERWECPDCEYTWVKEGPDY